MKLKKRIAALLMAGAMVCSTLPVNVLAVESSDQNAGGLCEHHTEHNADCGYVCEICSTEESRQPLLRQKRIPLPSPIKPTPMWKWER